MAVTAGRIAIVGWSSSGRRLDPECVHTPGVFAKRMIVAAEQRIERRTVRKA
jgi:hypothetical protein